MGLHYDTENGSAAEREQRMREKKEKARELADEAWFQEKILELVKQNQPIDRDEIVDHFDEDWFIVTTAFDIVESDLSIEEKYVLSEDSGLLSRFL